MCSRFTVDGVTWEEVRSIVSAVDKDFDLSRTGDVRPTEEALIIRGQGNDLIAGSMTRAD